MKRGDEDLVERWADMISHFRPGETPTSEDIARSILADVRVERSPRKVVRPKVKDRGRRR